MCVCVRVSVRLWLGVRAFVCVLCGIFSLLLFRPLTIYIGDFTTLSTNSTLNLLTKWHKFVDSYASTV